MRILVVGGAGFLAEELVAREPDHGEPLGPEAVLERLELLVLRCQSALGGDVHEERDLAALMVEQVGPTVEGRDGECVDAHRTGLLMG